MYLHILSRISDILQILGGLERELGEAAHVLARARHATAARRLRDGRGARGVRRALRQGAPRLRDGRGRVERRPVVRRGVERSGIECGCIEPEPRVLKSKELPIHYARDAFIARNFCLSVIQDRGT